jgi:hypothetical protein
MVGQLEQQLARQRTNLAHLDATMRLFDRDIRPLEIHAKPIPIVTMGPRADQW